MGAGCHQAVRVPTPAAWQPSREQAWAGPAESSQYRSKVAAPVHSAASDAEPASAEPTPMSDSDHAWSSPPDWAMSSASTTSRAVSDSSTAFWPAETGQIDAGGVGP